MLLMNLSNYGDIVNHFEKSGKDLTTDFLEMMKRKPNYVEQWWASPDLTYTGQSVVYIGDSIPTGERGYIIGHSNWFEERMFFVGFPDLDHGRPIVLFETIENFGFLNK
ncbi:hypothetical protein [Persicobacter diffluens]|uniref:Uncharacterized protein n=1 Tax=Persicobacter diffluens TaxID=981 RepID=A0AAN4VYR2_9BACT|nr:hypothetical protein PEDI_30780 [Persicobacter diffluens]